MPSYHLTPAPQQELMRNRFRTCFLQIIPADLNAWLMLLARDIATIARRLGHSEVAEAAAKSEALRRAALNEVAWSHEQVGGLGRRVPGVIRRLVSPCVPGSHDTGGCR